MKWLPTYESRKGLPTSYFSHFGLQTIDFGLRTDFCIGTYDFRQRTSNFERQNSDFWLQASDFKLQTSHWKDIGHSTWLSDVRSPMSNVQSPMSDVRYPISDIRYPISDIRCLMSDVRCPMPDRVMTYHIRTYFLLIISIFLCPWNWKKNWKKEKGLDSRLARACLVARSWLGLEVGSWNDRPNSVKLNRHDNVFVAFSFHQLRSSRLQFPRKNPYRG